MEQQRHMSSIFEIVKPFVTGSTQFHKIITSKELTGGGGKSVLPQNRTKSGGSAIFRNRKRALLH